MNSLITNLNERVVPALSLERADDCWLSTIGSSRLCMPFVALETQISAALSRFAVAGNLLQLLSYLIVCALFFVLAAKQFANDKNVLALVVVAAAGLRFVGLLFGGKEKYRPAAIDAVVLLVFATNVVSTFASHYLHESLHGLAKLAIYVIAYFLFTACFQYRSKGRMVGVLSALVAGGILVSLYGLWQFKMGVQPLATWEDPTIEDKATRVFSTLGNPNLLAGYLIPLVPFSFSLAGIALFAKGIWRWLALPLLGIAAVITLTTILTGSRGAYIALIFEAVACFMVAFTWIWRARPGLRIPMIALAILAPVGAVLLVHFGLPKFEHRFLSIFAGSEHSSNAYRLNVWKSSLAMFKDNWWLGIGTGNKTFEMAYGLYMRSGFDALGTYCVPLEVAVETGVPGLLAFLWLLVACLARAHSRFWGNSDPVVRWLALGSAAAIIGMMAHGLVDTVFLRPQVQFIFWLAIAMLVALPAPGKTDT